MRRNPQNRLAIFRSADVTSLDSYILSYPETLKSHRQRHLRLRTSIAQPLLERAVSTAPESLQLASPLWAVPQRYLRRCLWAIILILPQVNLTLTILTVCFLVVFSLDNH